MSMILEALDLISKRLSTVTDLLQMGEISRVDNRTLIFTTAHVETIIDMPEVQVGHAIYKKAGDRTSPHKHADSVEYIIQYSGKCGWTFENGGYRITNIGELVKIRKGELHNCVALEDNSKQVWVCVPAETGYKFANLLETLDKGILGGQR